MAATGVLLLLAASATALAIAPALMPESYSWVSNGTSESAAQGVNGAWLARLGFLLFGLAVLSLARLARPDWGRPAALLHSAFGVLMFAVAAFATRSWESGAAFDRTEDLLHNVAATTMGFAFAFGVLAVALRRAKARSRPRVVDVVAIAAAVVLPIAMGAWDDAMGALQRTLFLVAYVWYAVEATRITAPEAAGDEP